jgi:hypothetical protein
MVELEILPYVFKFDIFCFEIYGIFIARINRIHRGLPAIVMKFYADCHGFLNLTWFIPLPPEDGILMPKYVGVESL